MKKFKRFLLLILNYLLNVILIFLSYIIPKNKNLILLGSGGGKYFKGNTKYLFLYLLKNNMNGITFYWITQDKTIFLKLNKIGYPVIYKYTLKGFFYILKAKYLFIEQAPKDIYYIGIVFGKFNFIQTWHGSPIKKIGLSSFSKKDIFKNKRIILHFLSSIGLKNFKYISSCSKYLSILLEEAFNNKNVIITGYPRNDIFFNKDLYFNNYSKYKIGYKKIFLYVPTFRDIPNGKIIFSNKILEKLNQYLIKNNYIFYIKKHPFAKNLNIDLEKYSNIKDISDEIEDVQELLIYTDVVISDYSGVMFDFMLMNKPIILYSYDLEEYKNSSRGLYIDYYNDLPGPFCKNENDLLTNIINIDNLFKDKKYQIKYKNTLNKYNYFQDGKSCERVLNLIK